MAHFLAKNSTSLKNRHHPDILSKEIRKRKLLFKGIEKGVGRFNFW